MNSMQVEKEIAPTSYGAVVLRDSELNETWNWLNFQTLLSGQAFSVRRVDIQAK